MNNKTAILIFANSAKKEAASKSFKASFELFKVLNVHTIKEVKKTGLPYYVVSEKEQIGNSFGERFTNAIENIYEKGFENIITIGNDTPHLNSKHLFKALKKLEQNDIVLGPSKDGGFYLMGLKKSCFNKDTFLKLPWQTSGLNRSISKLKASKKVNLSALETLSDIDSQEDIKTVIDSFNNLPIAIKLLLLESLFKATQRTLYSTPCFYAISLNVHLNKGSPSTLHL